jgi:succinate dehydrogenase hydrophobic anchor subunit
VVIEDYVQREGRRLVAILLVQGAALALGVAGVIALLVLGFGGRAP